MNKDPQKNPIIDKVEYFKISEKLKLPFRCPILDVCERRLLSIYFNNYSDNNNEGRYIACLIHKNVVAPNILENIIESRGEEASCIRGDTLKTFNNFCPEVNLFDEYYAFSQAKGTACVSGEWDSFRKPENIFKGYKYGHFSECPKFNFYLSSEKLIKKNRRIGISKQLRFEIFTRDNFTCQYCGKKAEDGIKLHVDHKTPVSSGGKSDFNNLITACEDCNLGKSDKII